jgi:lysophospholipase L1-like esterase|tara:strand:- start:42 stop:809 length:768 start_codon:yes stop_codon:yes gene_type:complete
MKNNSIISFLQHFVLSIFLFSHNAFAEQIKILPLGDSITQGVGRAILSKDGIGYDSYRRLLYLKLKAAGYDVDFVGSMNRSWKCAEHFNTDFDTDHEGHFAWRVDEILNGRKGGCSGNGKLEDWLKNYISDIALIHLGTNDMFQNQSIDSTLDEIERVIDVLRTKNNNMLILVAKVLPVKHRARNSRIQSLNSRIDELTKRSSTMNNTVMIVDHYSAFNVDNSLFDGVHPNHLGEEIMAERWYQSILQALSLNAH